MMCWCVGDESIMTPPRSCMFMMYESEDRRPQFFAVKMNDLRRRRRQGGGGPGTESVTRSGSGRPQQRTLYPGPPCSRATW